MRKISCCIVAIIAPHMWTVCVSRDGNSAIGSETELLRHQNTAVCEEDETGHGEYFLHDSKECTTCSLFSRALTTQKHVAVPSSELKILHYKLNRRSAANEFQAKRKAICRRL